MLAMYLLGLVFGGVLVWTRMPSHRDVRALRASLASTRSDLAAERQKNLRLELLASCKSPSTHLSLAAKLQRAETDLAIAERRDPHEASRG